MKDDQFHFGGRDCEGYLTSGWLALTQKTCYGSIQHFHYLIILLITEHIPDVWFAALL